MKPKSKIILITIILFIILIASIIYFVFFSNRIHEPVNLLQGLTITVEDVKFDEDKYVVQVDASFESAYPGRIIFNTSDFDLVCEKSHILDAISTTLVSDNVPSGESKAKIYFKYTDPNEVKYLRVKNKLIKLK